MNDSSWIIIKNNKLFSLNPLTYKENSDLKLIDELGWSKYYKIHVTKRGDYVVSSHKSMVFYTEEFVR